MVGRLDFLGGDDRAGFLWVMTGGSGRWWIYFGWWLVLA